MSGATRSVILVLVLLGATSCQLTIRWHRDTSRFRRALALQRQGQHEQALALYRAITGERRYVGALNNMAVIHAEAGDTERSERLLVEATTIDPDLATLWANLGLVRYIRGQRDEAADALKEVAPARQRMLHRAVSNGRATWDYDDLKEKTRRSIRVARKYLEKLGADGDAASGEPPPRPPLLGQLVSGDLVLL